MMLNQASCLPAILGFCTLIQAHMFMNLPKPFESQDLSNAPLVGPGGGVSNYPCKQQTAGTYDFSFARTVMPLGSTQMLQLRGQAVHGGGSCQISISKDLAPTAKSEFKVIHSVEGGCPARNTEGNLGGSAGAIDPFTYNFTIPADVAPGDYTFAWTWFNKVGNREMYMNCAPISVTIGQSGTLNVPEPSSSGYDALPNMFLANIPDVSCTSPAEGPNANMQFPNPGSSVEINTPSNLSPPRGDVASCYAGGSAGGSGSSSGTPDSQISSFPAAAVTGGVLGSSAASATNTGASTMSSLTSSSASMTNTRASATSSLSRSAASATNIGASAISSLSSSAASATNVGATGMSGLSSSAVAGTSTVASAMSSATMASSAQGGAPGPSYIIATTLVTVSAAPLRATASYRPAMSTRLSAPKAAELGTGAPSASSTGAPSGPNTGAPSGSTAGAGSCGNGRIPCSNYGDIICIGSSQFGICDVDDCAVPQPLARGTTCSDGIIAKRHVHNGRHKHRRYSPFY